MSHLSLLNPPIISTSLLNTSPNLQIDFQKRKSIKTKMTDIQSKTINLTENATFKIPDTVGKTQLTAIYCTKQQFDRYVKLYCASGFSTIVPIKYGLNILNNVYLKNDYNCTNIQVCDVITSAPLSVLSPSDLILCYNDFTDGTVIRKTYD